jgi:hypothetical protein
LNDTCPAANQKEIEPRRKLREKANLTQTIQDFVCYTPQKIGLGRNCCCFFSMAKGLAVICQQSDSPVDLRAD